MTRRSAARAVLLVALAAMVSGGCGRRERPLRVGISAWPGYEFLHLASERGLFAAEGLDVRIVEFSALTDTRRAYELGQLDAMASSLVEVLTAADRFTRSPKIVRILAASRGSEVILGQPWITSLDGLRGKRVGVEAGALPAYVLARALERQGIRPADVALVSRDPMALIVAFREGDIEAIVTTPPFSIYLSRDLRAVSLTSDAGPADEVLHALSVDPQVLDSRPRDVAALLRALEHAYDLAAEQPTAALTTMAEREQLSLQEFGAALGQTITVARTADQVRYLRIGGPIAIALQRTERTMRAAGQLARPIRRDELVSLRYVDVWR